MMKAILILDIDEKIHNSNVTSIRFDNRETIFFMKDIKFKPIPYKDFTDEAEYYQTEEEYKAYMSGWNDCLHEILLVEEGEEE